LSLPWRCTSPAKLLTSRPLPNHNSVQFSFFVYSNPHPAVLKTREGLLLETPGRQKQTCTPPYRICIHRLQTTLHSPVLSAKSPIEPITTHGSAARDGEASTIGAEPKVGSSRHASRTLGELETCTRVWAGRQCLCGATQTWSRLSPQRQSCCHNWCSVQRRCCQPVCLPLV